MDSLSIAVSECPSLSSMYELIQEAETQYRPSTGPVVTSPRISGKVKLSELEKRIRELCEQSLCPDSERHVLLKLSRRMPALCYSAYQNKCSYRDSKPRYLRIFYAQSSHFRSPDFSYIRNSYYQKEELSTCLNSCTLVGHPVSQFPKSKLFITDTKHCLLIEEIQEILKSESCLYNPYTRAPFSRADYDKLRKLRELRVEINHLSHAHRFQDL